ncbi:MAG: hypothetical protein V1792_03600 [Pseudomonadota bacterium]
MASVRIVSAVAAISIGCVLLACDSGAQWSVDLSNAQNEFVYGRYGQLGRNGFFGTYDIDASSTPGAFASINGWLGNRDDDIGTTASGTNASLSSTSLVAQPRFSSAWISAAGRYTIRSYQTSQTSGSYVAMSPGQLTLWTISANTPLGAVSWGKQEFGRGFGLQFASSRSEEYLALEKSVQVPNILQGLVYAGILPRGVISWFNPEGWPRYVKETPEEGVKHVYSDKDDIVRWKKEYPKCVDGECFDPQEPFLERYAQSTIGPADLLLGIAVYPWQRINVPGAAPLPGYDAWNGNDLGAARSVNYALYLLYATNDLTFGLGGTRVAYHVGPELQRTVAARNSAPTIEEYLTEGWSFIRYNNGIILFRTELDWFNKVTRYQRSANGTFFGTPENVDGSGSVFASDYVESWRYMAELGVLRGPVSARIFYSFMPGPDRRHGILIDRQPFIQDEPRAAFGVFEPYSILLSYYFGGGVNAPAHINDAAVYAGKIDYMLASNLVVEASVLKAYRTSHGYGWGYIRPNTAAGHFGSIDYIDYNVPGTFTNPSPAIPEGDLGWEFTAGITWKLLEEFLVSVRMAYWNPGRWFNYACIDRAVPSWDIPAAANNWGINPNRDIDSLLGLEIRLSGSF